MDARKKRALRLNASKYKLISNVLFRKNDDGVLLICLEEDDSQKVLSELHDEPIGGHFGGNTTTHKVLRVGYYSPTLFKMHMKMFANVKFVKHVPTNNRNLLIHLNW